MPQSEWPYRSLVYFVNLVGEFKVMSHLLSWLCRVDLLSFSFAGFVSAPPRTSPLHSEASSCGTFNISLHPSFTGTASPIRVEGISTLQSILGW